MAGVIAHMKKIHPKAIVVGGVTDVVLSMLVGIPFTNYVIESRGLSELPAGEVTPAVLAAVQSSVGLSLLQFATGFSCSMLGGYVAAALARSHEILNGALASWLCIGLGIYMLLSGALGDLHWQYIVSVVATPLCYWAGAYFWLRRNRPLLFE
jgi:hypothetical protein